MLKIVPLLESVMSHLAVKEKGSSIPEPIRVSLVLAGLRCLQEALATSSVNPWVGSILYDAGVVPENLEELIDALCEEINCPEGCLFYRGGVAS
jgi:hypothetical protein